MEAIIKKAKFISGDPDWGLVCPVFEKSFELESNVKSAELQISALGVYEARINGKRVGDRYMAPGWTVYEKRVQYQTYDVTEMLFGGNNVINIGAGHGWYASRIGAPTTTKGVYDQYPSVICALKIELANGKTVTVLSDESWKAARSGVLVSQIYDGETFDARVVPEYNENARVYDFSSDKLIPDEGDVVRIIEKIGVKEIIHTPKGETVLDFGQNITGCLEFTVTGRAGDTVTVEHAEILGSDGNFYNANYRSAKALTKYILKDGTQTYRSIYTFYGFRYVRLGSWCEDVRAENFTALVIHSDMKRTGYFKCGVPKVNKLFENIIWGQRDNFLDIPTDCPQRDERLGWTGDAQVFCRTAAINYDVERFFRKWLRDVMLSQFENGQIPHVVPSPFDRAKHSSAAWGDVATVAPWEMYVAYGDRSELEKLYPMMQKWVEYIHSFPGNEYLWQNGEHFGDWLGLDAPEGSYKGSTSEELIASAYFYYSTSILVKAGKVLGYDMSNYEEMKKKIAEEYRKAYFDGDKLVSDTQTAYAVTLHFGLAGDKKDAFGKRLVELIEAFGDRLQTGFVGTPYLLDALSECGRYDKAYTLLLQDKYPSWLFSVDMGATTIWEHWDGLKADGSVWSTDMNSFNHYAYGSVAAWMYRTAAGISPDENAPAYKHVFINPVPDKRLGSVKARIDTKNGSVVSEWVYEGEYIRYGFSVPSGVTATVTVNGHTEELGEGSYTRWSKA